MKLYKVINYSGMVAIVLLCATFVFGIAHLDREVHEHLAIATMVFAIIHGGLVLYRTIRLKMSQSLFKH